MGLTVQGMVRAAVNFRILPPNFPSRNDGIGGAGCFYTDCTTFIGGFIVLVSTS
jgi:hypothetical protein